MSPCLYSSTDVIITTRYQRQNCRQKKVSWDNTMPITTASFIYVMSCCNSMTNAILISGKSTLSHVDCVRGMVEFFSISFTLSSRLSLEFKKTSTKDWELSGVFICLEPSRLRNTALFVVRLLCCIYVAPPTVLVVWCDILLLVYFFSFLLLVLFSELLSMNGRAPTLSFQKKSTVLRLE